MAEESLCVKIRGLPWSATADEIMNFFSDCNVAGGEEGVHLTFTRDGKPTGEAYIEFASLEDKNTAIVHNNQHMGKRYIEVFSCNQSEMEYMVKRTGSDQGQDLSDATVRLRGLPFGCSKEEIATFFTGCEIRANGITLIADIQGRPSGDAFVQFVSQTVAENACKRHKERIGHRYIEIFRSSMSECKSSMHNGGFMGRGGGAMQRNFRPSPYERQDRYGGPGGGMGNFGGRGGGFGGRGRSMKGHYDEDQFDRGFGGGYGGGGGYGRGQSTYRGNSQIPGGAPNSTTGHAVYMRGLPFGCTEDEISNFFMPVDPVQVVIRHSASGRPTGEADVDFASHEDAVAAMKKDRCNIQHRYIELFMSSNQDGGMTSTRQGMDRGAGNNWDAEPRMGARGYGATSQNMGGDMGGYMGTKVAGNSMMGGHVAGGYMAYQGEGNYY